MAIDQVPDVVLWAPTVSAAIAALAAGAAWRAASVTSRSFRRSISPELHAIFTSNAELQAGAELELVVRNLGGGVAKMPSVILIVKDHALHTNVGPGFLRSGKGYRIRTLFSVGELEGGDYLAVVTCRDVNNLFHAWTAASDHHAFRDWRRRPMGIVDMRDVVAHFYPDKTIEGLKPIRHTLEFDG